MYALGEGSREQMLRLALATAGVDVIWCTCTSDVHLGMHSAGRLQMTSSCERWRQEDVSLKIAFLTNRGSRREEGVWKLGGK